MGFKKAKMETDHDIISSDALAPGSKLLTGQYEIVNYLSSGGFGITYLAKDSLNRTVVIKECFPGAFCTRSEGRVHARSRNHTQDFRSIVDLFIREAHALSRLDHPSVVGVHQVFEDNDTAYMALDLVDGKDLLDIIESGAPKLTPTQVRQLALDLLDAIGHVHAQDLLHRDISPDNILLDSKGRPVLIDFGAAREEASRKSRVLSAVLVVKDGYSPQEFYVAGSQQMPSSDLYALAATLYHLIAGEAPPNSQARLAALASKQPDLYVPLVGRFPDYDEALLSAIDTSMNIIPANRIQSADDWILAIDHTKRAEIARARAQSDESIDEKVTELVKSVNSHPIFTQKPAPAEPSEKRAPDAVSKRAKAKPVEDLSYVPVASIAEAQRQKEAIEQAPRETPYLRVKSKAIEAAKAAKEAQLERQKEHRKARIPRLSRLATVPVVFCAYFFYGQTALQFDGVKALTVQPISNIELDLGFMAGEPSKPEVRVRRGTN